MSGRWWTDEDLRFLREQYPRRTAKWIGRKLGRAAHSVLLKAAAVGLRKNRVGRGAWRGEIAEWLRGEIEAGRMDGEIADRWNALGKFRVDRRTIGYYRVALGLGTSDAVRQRRLTVRRDGYRRQLATLGCRSVADIWARYRRRVAASAGWPLDCTPFECRVLSLLANGRPLTRRELVQALRAEDGGEDREYVQRKALQTSAGCGSVLGNLVRRGLVVRSNGRPVTGRGKGHSWSVYSLSRRAAEHHARCTRRRYVG